MRRLPSCYTFQNIRSACAAALLSALLLFSVWSTELEAETVKINGVKILARGIFTAESSETVVAHGRLGPVNRVHGPKLAESTTLIPGRRAMRFGVRYIVAGSPRNAEIQLRLVTVFPVDGFFDATTNVKHAKNEYVVRVLVGQPNYRDFHFRSVDEIVPGVWTFEFWHGDIKIGEQEFCVYVLESRSAIDLPSNRSCAVGVSSK
jgi:hypothetical protein